MASLWESGPIIFGPTEDLVSWLQRKGLLASSRGGLSRGVISLTEVCGGVRGSGSGTASIAMAVPIFEANKYGCGILWVCFLRSMRSVQRGLHTPQLEYYGFLDTT